MKLCTPNIWIFIFSRWYWVKWLELSTSRLIYYRLGFKSTFCGYLNLEYSVKDLDYYFGIHSNKNCKLEKQWKLLICLRPILNPGLARPIWSKMGSNFVGLGQGHVQIKIYDYGSSLTRPTPDTTHSHPYRLLPTRGVNETKQSASYSKLTRSNSTRVSSNRTRARLTSSRVTRYSTQKLVRSSNIKLSIAKYLKST